MAKNKDEYELPPPVGIPQPPPGPDGIVEIALPEDFNQ